MSKEKEKGKKIHPLRLVLLFLLKLVCFLVVLVIAFFALLTVTEWKPADVEEAELVRRAEKTAVPAQLTILSWNTGYAALSETEDFFMDGGTKVRPDSRDLVFENQSRMAETAVSYEPDILLLQEVDNGSRRSYNVKEKDRWTDYFSAAAGPADSAYAMNYNAPFVPYPIPPIGKVKSGLLTLSAYAMESAQRVQLPISFTWPVRMANLKRCLLVTRFPLEQGGELVVINLHNEAYAPAEKKEAQTAVLKGLLESEYAKGNYVIAGGDWNQTFPEVDPSLYPVTDAENYVAETMDPGSCPEGWQFAYDESVPTCRLLNAPYDPAGEKTQYYVIDGFLVSPNVAVESVETQDLGFANTDHNPVLLRVTLDSSTQ